MSKNSSDTHTLAKMTIHLLLMAEIILTASVAGLGFGGPNIQITSPSGNFTVPAGNATIAVHTGNFNAVDPLGRANVNGGGTYSTSLMLGFRPYFSSLRRLQWTLLFPLPA